jgi:hypothetical protein
LAFFKNMPYQIPEGVNFKVLTFVAGEFRGIYKYQTVATASTHLFATKNPITQTTNILL